MSGDQMVERIIQYTIQGFSICLGILIFLVAVIVVAAIGALVVEIGNRIKLRKKKE